MITVIFNEFKKWWSGSTSQIIGNQEFDRIESKHTRIHYDEGINEIIRVR